MTEGALRVSFSEENTMEDVEYLIENLVDIVDKIRKKSHILYVGKNLKNCFKKSTNSLDNPTRTWYI